MNTYFPEPSSVLASMFFYFEPDNDFAIIYILLITPWSSQQVNEKVRNNMTRNLVNSLSATWRAFSTLPNTAESK
jgi:hypothetical protein